MLSNLLYTSFTNALELFVRLDMSDEAVAHVAAFQRGRGRPPG